MRLLLSALLTCFMVCCGQRAICVEKVSVPTAEQALVNAIRLAKDQGIFEKPVIVGVNSDKIGVYSVDFKRPAPNTMVTPGQKKTEPIFTISVASQRSTVIGGPWVIDDKATGPETESKALACAVALEHLYATGMKGTELELDITEKENKGFNILVSRIPFTPGGHTFVEISSEYKVLNTMPGR